jgi:hypothetical protein
MHRIVEFCKWFFSKKQEAYKLEIDFLQTGATCDKIVRRLWEENETEAIYY